ncbi:hypothetical protein EDE04_0476 [Streptomyces sp. 2132.2]|nr:hypothetical protein EDE04_0476 [Streptomyces sp. 2132.2]
MTHLNALAPRLRARLLDPGGRASQRLHESAAARQSIFK